jgi:hypothetical protein
MPPRTAVGTMAIVFGIVIVILVAGVLFFANQSNPNPVTPSTQSTTSITSVKTIVSSQSTTPSSVTTSAASETCYQGSVPTNSSASGSQSAYSRTVFNVTQEFGSWSWNSLSAFSVGSYTFVTTNPATAPGVFQLEPQLFFNVTNSQGQVQRTSVTNLGGWNGQVWPPDMSLEQTLFGGNVTLQWLFLCNGQSVFLEVTTQ